MVDTVSLRIGCDDKTKKISQKKRQLDETDQRVRREKMI